jgi:hypothetical protein
VILSLLFLLEQLFTVLQGVIASGLAALSVANNDPSLLSQAEITLDATITKLTVNNILKESCDNTAPGGTLCNRDQQSFKVRATCFRLLVSVADHCIGYLDETSTILLGCCQRHDKDF